jgi:beta-mannosidase
MDLSGAWRAITADDDVRRDGVGLGVDDSAWSDVRVPGHWRSHPDFATSDGPLVYRRRFEQEPPADGRRRWIVLDGIFYQGDVWLDGAYLGDPEGYFMPHAFDVTALSRLSSEHVIAVEVACPPIRSARGRRNVTGVFQYWDGMDREWNPGGLWGPVRVEDTGPARVDRFRVLCRDADDSRAHLLLRARIDSDTGRSVRLRTSIDGRRVGETERVMARGVNEVGWTVDIDHPALWWPRSLGEQPLTEISVEAVVDGGVSDRCTHRTGLREVAWKDWVCSVNGERLFLKGANLLPTRPGLADATPEDARRDVELAADVGLDVLRVHGHIARAEVYAAADEAGILLLQDFPLQWGYSRGVRRQAVSQAQAAVDVLGHHPSIVLWTAHNDPAAVALGMEGDTPRSRLRYALGHQLPSWNKTVLDRWVKRSIERADVTRPVVAHSGVLPHLPQLEGTDSHLYFGWYHGEARELGPFAARLPRVVRFVSEFGAQSVPVSDEFIDRSSWPELDWESLESRHGLQRWVFEERVPPGSFETYEAWRLATQQYQEGLLRHQIETLRRLKYHPTGGFCLFSFNDPMAAVSFSIYDHERVPKPAVRAVREACVPVLVVADRPPDIVSPGDDVSLDVHVVNDLRTAVDPAVIDVEARWAGGRRRWRFGGDVAADSCAKVGTVRLSVPDTLGTLTFHFTLTAGPVTSTNSYRTVVTVK